MSKEEDKPGEVPKEGSITGDDPFTSALDVACVARNVQEQARHAEMKARYPIFIVMCFVQPFELIL